MSIGFISHSSFFLHDNGDYHPECAQRLHAINDRLITTGLEPYLFHKEAQKVSLEALSRAHSPAYIEHIFRSSPSQGIIALDGDTSMNRHTLEAALHAAGANEQAVDMLMHGEIKRAFCAVRPPGHHAEQNRAMGFCIFNNIAIAALHAIEQYGLERVAIVDFDVHHGNGTEDILKDNQNILFCSTFQHPFYPYSGADTKQENIINCPLPAGSGSPEFRGVVSQKILPALENFKPQLILISAGFDAHTSDDMANLHLHESDYQWITRKLCDIANRFCEGKIISTLEGGYVMDALAMSVVSHIKTLIYE